MSSRSRLPFLALICYLAVGCSTFDSGERGEGVGQCSADEFDSIQPPEPARLSEIDSFGGYFGKEKAEGSAHVIYDPLYDDRPAVIVVLSTVSATDSLPSVYLSIEGAEEIPGPGVYDVRLSHQRRSRSTSYGRGKMRVASGPPGERSASFEGCVSNDQIVTRFWSSIDGTFRVAVPTDRSSPF